MRIFTRALELVVPSDRPHTQRLRHKSARRMCHDRAPPLERLRPHAPSPGGHTPRHSGGARSRAQPLGCPTSSSLQTHRPALTRLLRPLLSTQLVVRAGHEPGADRPAEREIAAALESVFPRIGLKAFTSLAPEDKSAQLQELANIVLGIRLFNRHIGKGGAGISDVPRTAAELAASLIGQVGEDVEGLETLCQQYVDVIAHKYKSTPAGSKPGRLQQELVNRRQYVAYLETLSGGFQQSGAHIEQLTRMLLTEVETLKQLVGARSSVPKEQVYPRFDSLAKLWASFKEELATLQADAHLPPFLTPLSSSPTPPPSPVLAPTPHPAYPAPKLTGSLSPHPMCRRARRRLPSCASTPSRTCPRSARTTSWPPAPPSAPTTPSSPPPAPPRRPRAPRRPPRSPPPTRRRWRRCLRRRARPRPPRPRGRLRSW